MYILCLLSREKPIVGQIGIIIMKTISFGQKDSGRTGNCFPILFDAVQIGRTDRAFVIRVYPGGIGKSAVL